MAQVTSFTQSSIANLYIAILGRNPEPSGFGYWCDVLAKNNNSQAAINAIAEGFAKTPEFIGTYGGRTTTQAVTAMYNNVLNRAPDATGLAYWTNYANALITAGQEVGDAYAITGNAIITVAAANNGTADQTLINGKQATAIASGLAAPSTTVSLTTNIDTLNFGSNTTVIGVVSGNVETQTLNAGDSIVGTGNNNTLRIVDTVASSPAVNPLSGVTLTGVQTVTIQAAVAGTPAVAAVTGVSAADASIAASGMFVPAVTAVTAVTAVDGTYLAKAYNLSGTTGVTTVQSTNAASTTTLNLTGLAAGTTVSVSGANAGTSITNFTYQTLSSAATVNLNGGLTSVQNINNVGGTNTAATITSTGGVNGVATSGAAANAVLSLSAGATLNSLTVNAATNMRATLTNTNFAATGTDLVVSGAATSVNLGGTTSATAGIYKTINASGLTSGGVTVNASTQLTSFIGGGGNDTLTRNAATNAASIATTAVIDAGAGRDTLDAALVNAGNAVAFRNFEVLSTANGAAVVLDTSLLSNSTISGVSIGGTATNSALSNLVTTAATPFTIAVNSTNAANTAISLAFTAASIAGAADTVAYSFAGTSGSAISAGVVTHQGIEFVTIASNGIAGSSNQLVITDNALQSVTVTGARALNLSVTGQTVVGAGTALSTINASGMTPASSANGLNFTELAAGAGTTGYVNGLTITGSSANDVISVRTANPGGVTDNFGSDTVIITNGGVDTVNVRAATAQLNGLSVAPQPLPFGYTTITGAGSGDQIIFAQSSVMSLGTSATPVVSATSLFGAVTAALTNTSAGLTNWFVFGGNTYIASNVDATTGLQADDIVVQLTGVVDLSTSSIANGTGSFVGVNGILTIA